MKSARLKTALAILAGIASLFFIRADREPEPSDAVPEVIDSRSDQERILLRLHAKDCLARELLAGQRSLAETATMFRVLDETPPVRAGVIAEDECPPSAIAEAYCRQVLLWVKPLLIDQPLEQAQATMAAFENELATLRAAPDGFALPAPTTPDALKRAAERSRLGGPRP